MKTTLEILDELYRAVQAQLTVIRRVQLPVIKSKPGGKKITLAQVKKAEEATYESEANHYAQLMRRSPPAQHGS